MKEPLAFEAGRVVESTQGRDRGGIYLVLGPAGGDCVLIADGLTHPLEKPKKKKTRHLRARPVRIDLEQARPEGGKLQSSDLRRALENAGFVLKKNGKEVTPKKRCPTEAGEAKHGGV